MRPDVLVGPSDWVIEQFGDKVAAELWTRVPEALNTAIEREVNTHPSVTQTERVLANPRWPLPYEELVLFLGTLPGAEIISVPRSVYQLVVLNGHVVVPWCYGQSARDSIRDVPVGRSFGRLARELLRRFGPPWRRSQAETPLPLDAVDEREVAKICAAIAKIDPAPEVVIAGYAGAPHLGLLRACLGEIKSTDNGTLNWSHLDDLPLPPPVIPRPRRMVFP
ncbi:hypothetical protein [Actinoplanes sp. RD1]|uniref:hypothetical protein n=1 Tax=Actinoplanes sp. RD1 TaxID=3064538 RepID=UPI002741DAD8|nr:hypothetical protein [Actinoplanes sp. RD1]